MLSPGLALAFIQRLLDVWHDHRRRGHESSQICVPYCITTPATSRAQVVYQACLDICDDEEECPFCGTFNQYHHMHSPKCPMIIPLSLVIKNITCGCYQPARPYRAPE